MTYFNNADIHNPEHQRLLEITTRIFYAYSLKEFCDGLDALSTAIIGKPLETRQLACNFAVAAIGGALDEQVEMFIANNFECIDALTRAFFTARNKLHKEMDDYPVFACMGVKCSVTQIQETYAAICRVETVEELCEILYKVGVYKASGADNGYSILCAVENALSSVLIERVIPDYLSTHHGDDMTANRFSAWCMLAHLTNDNPLDSYYDDFMFGLEAF